MITIPLPFVIAILLSLLLVELLRRDDGFRLGQGPANAPFLALIAISIVQSLLLGLRWGYGLHPVIYVMPVLAALVPPLAYAGVMRLVSARPMTRRALLGLCLVPTGLILVLMLVWRDALDIALALIFILHAGAIFALMRPGADALRQMPFENATPAFRSVLFAGFALLFSAALDLYVFFDLSDGGSHAIAVITTGNLAVLFILSGAAAIASRGGVPEEVPEPAAPESQEADREVMDQVNRLLAERHIYRDPELTLERLARKSLIPARQISAAINRSTGSNVSQYVNAWRVGEACQLLAGSDRPVTGIMFDVGFQTKSNFNREFRRVTDMTPMEWRARHQTPPG